MRTQSGTSAPATRALVPRRNGARTVMRSVRTGELRRARLSATLRAPEFESNHTHARCELQADDKDQDRSKST